MSDQENDLLKFIAGMDQAISALSIIMPMIRSYYTNLVESGFTPAQAMTLTESFQQVYWTHLLGGKKPS